jgi:diguanylate cyclase (GGDEF)-like protein
MRIELAHAKRNCTLLAVMFIDLDGFKDINDTMGHDAGDKRLKQVAVRLTTSLRDCDSVVRIGGDEFVVIQTQLNDQNGAAQVAQKSLIT